MRIRGESRARWGSAVLLGCAALLASAPTALAASGTGKISGTVTSACACEDFNPLKNIEVTVYETGANGLPEGFATTNEHGEYTVEKLAAGSYKVRFSMALESTLNFAAQYYKEKSSFTTAESVNVVEGETTKAINAELQVGGKIEGTVTEAASPGSGLAGVGVTVYEASGSRFPVGFATTTTGGKYTVSGLATGTYKVEFSPEFESGLNFIGQFYEGKTSLASAESVAVTQESTKSGVNAKLLAGGEISGTVTDAATHKPVAGVFVSVFEAVSGEEVFESFAITNGNGEYTLAGLRSGVYKIQFETGGGGTQYISQFYNDEPSLASANPVTANQGSITPGINASLVREAPVDTAAPVASGTPAVGQVLSCSKGSWTGSPTPTFSYTWLRNGLAIASGSAYVVQTADRGYGLSCRVTAKNKIGSAAAVSNTLVVPPLPPPPPPKPVITLLNSRILVAGGSARVPISCTNTTCRGTIELTDQAVVRHRRGRRTIVIRKTVILARGSYALTAGNSATIAVRMTAAGKRALSRARHLRLSAKLIASVSGGLTLRAGVLLTEPKPKRHIRR